MNILKIPINFRVTRRCYSLFDLDKIIADGDVSVGAMVSPLPTERHSEVVQLMKREFFQHHPLVRAHGYRGLATSRALDNYILDLLKRGDSLCATTKDGELIGACVNMVALRSDPKDLEAFASCRQDPELKELLYFTAKLQVTPNLWDEFEEDEIFEVRMLAVAAERRRRGVGCALARGAAALAGDRGCAVVRMDCGDVVSCKVAEKCNMKCVHKLQLCEVDAQDGGAARAQGDGGAARAQEDGGAARAQGEGDPVRGEGEAVGAVSVYVERARRVGWRDWLPGAIGSE